MAKHEDFIKSPIESVLLDGVQALSAIDNGIEAYPLNDYLMKTIFLQMTGFQEQKFKCLAWDVATEDYEFRRYYLEKFATQGFSTYDSKNLIYQKIMDLLARNEFSEDERKAIVNQAKDTICDIFSGSQLQYWNSSVYNEFKGTIKAKVGYKSIANGKTLIDGEGKRIYDKLYYHRNRLAHNTLSYQRNLPTLDSLENAKYGDTNYFVWFYLLVVIDMIVIKLYEEFNDKNHDYLQL